MKINIQFLLNKKRISLETFCDLNNLQSYSALLEYCEDKKLICIDENDYAKIIDSKKKEKNEENLIEKPKVETRRRGKKQKAKATRHSDSKDNS